MPCIVIRSLRVWHFLLVAISVFVASACSDNPAGPSAPLNQSFVLKVGETAYLPDARLELKFDGVTSDSRCPGDAICISAGDAVVAITATSRPGPTVRYELHTAGPATVRHQSFTVALEELAPYPFSSLPPLDPASYEATLRVSP